MVSGSVLRRTATSWSSNFFLSFKWGKGWLVPSTMHGKGNAGLKPLPPPAPAR